MSFPKAALSSQLFKDPECRSERGLNPRPLFQHTGAVPTELTRRRLNTTLNEYFYDPVWSGYLYQVANSS